MLVIIGLMSSAVILTMPTDKPVVVNFANDFHRDMNLAAQTSILSGKSVALGLSEDSYSFLKYDSETWITVQQGDWPDGTFVSFEKDKTPIKLAEDIVPLVMFEPTGQTTIFSLKLADVEHGYLFESSGDGRVNLEVLQ